MSWLHHPAVQLLLPFPILALLGAAIWRVFRGTWRELDEEALALRSAGGRDHRAIAACVLSV